jgi:hypothetical protein
MVPDCLSWSYGQICVEHWMPTAEELADDAQRIEAYRCEACQVPVRFARYNDPAKLIETRYIQSLLSGCSRKYENFKTNEHHFCIL